MDRMLLVSGGGGAEAVWEHSYQSKTKQQQPQKRHKKLSELGFGAGINIVLRLDKFLLRGSVQL